MGCIWRPKYKFSNYNYISCWTFIKKILINPIVRYFYSWRFCNFRTRKTINRYLKHVKIVIAWRGFISSLEASKMDYIRIRTYMFYSNKRECLFIFHMSSIQCSTLYIIKIRTALTWCFIIGLLFPIIACLVWRKESCQKKVFYTVNRYHLSKTIKFENWD